ncbi:MAG: hypothetical protein A2V70_02925 [Planctomycetes bacterium RBG_13_63_9]|nr:MAG: hypothetical protein A2V70_02925 [Planctomycetes bacterium RBG_13_63_9]
MTSTGKTFDCVEMKNCIQAERLTQYRSQRGKYTSYVDFINSRVEDSELAKIVRGKAGAPPARETP